VNVTDGRYVHHRYPPDLRTQEIYQYTVMPTHMASPFTPEELRGAGLARAVPVHQGRAAAQGAGGRDLAMHKNYGPGCLLEDETRLYDVEDDPARSGRSMTRRPSAGCSADARADGRQLMPRRRP
jgi:hypothetical protein